jgi:hypothetical protein
LPRTEPRFTPCGVGVPAGTALAAGFKLKFVVWLNGVVRMRAG